MKKESGFQKFFKGREKTGGAKKEEFRQDKRKERKEREEKIANAKREKRAKFKASASNEPPKYNLEPPVKRFSKKATDERSAPPYKGEKKRIELRQKPGSSSGNQKPGLSAGNQKFASSPGNQKPASIQPIKNSLPLQAQENRLLTRAKKYIRPKGRNPLKKKPISLRR
jgi:hypothetical protein